MTVHFEMFKIIYQKVLYCSKSVMKSGSILKPRYIQFHIISGLQCIRISDTTPDCLNINLAMCNINIKSSSHKT